MRKQKQDNCFELDKAKWGPNKLHLKENIVQSQSYMTTQFNFACLAFGPGFSFGMFPWVGCLG